MFGLGSAEMMPAAQSVRAHHTRARTHSYLHTLLAPDPVTPVGCLLRRRDDRLLGRRESEERPRTLRAGTAFHSRRYLHTCVAFLCASHPPVAGGILTASFTS